MKAHSRLTHTPTGHLFKFLLTALHIRLFGGIFGIHVGAGIVSGAKLSNLARKAIQETLVFASLLISSFPALLHASPSVAFDRKTPVYIDVRAEFNSSVICPDGRYYRTEFGTYINCENFDLWHESLDHGIRLTDIESKSPLK